MLIRSQQKVLTLTFGLKVIDKTGSCYQVSDNQKEIA